jgi:cytochrome bd-type quinol oxidase subunit 2
MDIAESLRKLTVGRVAYCVVAAILLSGFFTLMLDPGQTKDEQFRASLFTWIVLIVDLPVVLVGVGILLLQKSRQQPLKFWTIAVLMASLPILVIIFRLFLGV